MKTNEFLRKFLVIVICLFLLDKGLGLILQHYYFKIRHGELGRTNYVMDSCVSETIILGSSRAAHHYVSPVIAEILNSSCYNAGQDKQRLIYCLAILNSIYQRYSPKEIILDLNPTALEKNENGLDELGILLPYYSSHPEIRQILNMRNRFEWIKARSSLYCYNSLPLKIIFNNISNQRDANALNGYVPLLDRKALLPDSAGNLPAPQPIDDQIVSTFKNLIQLAKEHHSKLYVVVSPIYFRIPKDLVSLSWAKTICMEKGISFLDYSQDAHFLGHGPEMFLDDGHLNDSSARLFSTMMATDLKKIK
ncbi:MAG TPA: hypothetical protein VK622_08080 [Puia sp.]|nr:hypothetical protein [Puia sp.]